MLHQLFMQDTALQQFSDNWTKPSIGLHGVTFQKRVLLIDRSFSRIQAKFYVIGSDNTELSTRNKFKMFLFGPLVIQRLVGCCLAKLVSFLEEKNNYSYKCSNYSQIILCYIWPNIVYSSPMYIILF